MASALSNTACVASGFAASPARRSASAKCLSSSRICSGTAALKVNRGHGVVALRASRRSTVAVNALFSFGKKGTESDAPFYNINVDDIDGKKLSLSKFKGKVVLVTNVASECGFTKQYTGLADLYNKYSKQGFVVLGAPCNQFGKQEPGDNKQIKSFAAKQGAKFPLTAKLDVNGPNESELYTYLKSQQGGLLNKDVKWNFSKFLVDQEGNVVKRYFSTAEPAEIEKDIVALL